MVTRRQMDGNASDRIVMMVEMDGNASVRIVGSFFSLYFIHSSNPLYFIHSQLPLFFLSNWEVLPRRRLEFKMPAADGI